MSFKTITTFQWTCDGCGEESEGKDRPDGWIFVGGYVEATAEGKEPARLSVEGANLSFHSAECLIDALDTKRGEKGHP
jgi:hypothetical protein